nr:ribonuclease H-like domain-containing protein [Tanacetum cinerariifolium]
MVTRSQLGIVKPTSHISLNTFSISPIPKNLHVALKDPQWRNAMYDEYNALVKNGTWLLVPRPAGVNMVGSMWLFTHKFHADGTLSRYMALLVANGSSQQLGVDFDENFSPFVKPATIHTVLSLDRNSTGLFLSQWKYALQRFEHAHMVHCNPSRTHIDTESKLGSEDLSYVVQQVCLYMHDPMEPHFAGLKCILRYVRGTVDFGLQLYVSATTSLVGYIDDWTAKRQHTLSLAPVPELNTVVLLTLS